MIRPVQITFRNMGHSVPLEEEIRASVAWLDRFSPDLVGCRVVVEVPHRHHERGRPVHVVVELLLPGENAVVSHEPTLHGHLKDTHAGEHHKDGDVDAARRRLEDLTRRQRGNVKTHPVPAPDRSSFI